MRLVRLGVAAFGRFSNQSIELGPGLNVVFGPNEAGKSTIQRFILGMLYGLKKQGTRRDYSAEHAKYQPWDGDAYRGTLIYRLDDGHVYRVERDFSVRRERVAIYDEVTGEDLTDTFSQDRRKELTFAERHLRVSEGVFVSTVWVGQLETAKLAMAGELSQRVANLQESGREDLSVREALRVLDEQLKEIGSERAPTRPYARTLRQVEEKEAELARAASIRDQTLEWEQRLIQVQAELQQVNQHYEVSRLRELELRAARARQLAGRLEELTPRLELLEAYADYPVEYREQLQRLDVEIRTLAEQEERDSRRLQAVESQRSELAEEAQRYQSMAGLGAAVLSDLTTAAALLRTADRQAELLGQELDRVAEANARLEDTLGPLQDVAEQGAAVVARVEQLEAEIGRLRNLTDPAATAGLEGPVRGSRGGNSGALAGALLIVIGLLVAGFGLLLQLGVVKALGPLDQSRAPAPMELVGAVLLAAGAFVLFRQGSGGGARRRSRSAAVSFRVASQAEELAVRHRLRELEAECEQLLVSARAPSSAELKSRLIRWEQLAARRDNYQARLHTLQAERKQHQDEGLRNRLVAASILAGWQGVTPDLAQVDEAAVEEFRQAWAHWLELRQRQASLAREYEEVAERQHSASRRLAEAQGQLDEYLRRAGAPSIPAYLQGFRAREECLQVRAEYDAAQHALEQALRGQRLESLLAQVHDLRQRVGAAGELAGQPVAAQLLQEDVQALEVRRSELMSEVSVLNGRLETALRDVADLADLQRELDTLREELSAMDRDIRALELARDSIDLVSGEIHREFAPVLNQTMSSILASVTRGRYTEVRVDERLGLRALAGDDRLVDVWDLSSGTVDQFYFALRLALVNLITAGNERLPMMLDDPFVQYDDERLRGTLGYLQQQVRDGGQVLLFTCHRRDVEIARGLGASILDLSGM